MTLPLFNQSLGYADIVSKIVGICKINVASHISFNKGLYIALDLGTLLPLIK